jgi:hypothetical protein
MSLKRKDNISLVFSHISTKLKYYLWKLDFLPFIVGINLIGIVKELGKAQQIKITSDTKHFFQNIKIYTFLLHVLLMFVVVN